MISAHNPVAEERNDRRENEGGAAPVGPRESLTRLPLRV